MDREEFRALDRTPMAGQAIGDDRLLAIAEVVDASVRFDPIPPVLRSAAVAG